MGTLVAIIATVCFGAALSVAVQALLGPVREARALRRDIPPEPDPHQRTAQLLQAELQAVEQDSLDGPVFDVPGDPPVTVHLHHRGGRNSVSLIADVGGPDNLRIVPEDALRFRDPLIGEPTFDGSLHLRGPADWLSAALHQTARQDLLWLNSQGLLSIDGGLLALQTSGLRPEQVLAVVGRIQSVAAALALPIRRIPEQLLVRASTEPGGPRAFAAVRLLAFRSGTPEARTLAERLDPRPADVLELLPDDLDHHLDRLARAVLEPARADTVLPLVLGHEQPDIALAAVAALRDLGTVACIPALEAAARGPLKKPALAAVARIRDRVGPNTAGALTVVEDADAGALALTAEQRGALAIKTKA